MDRVAVSRIGGRVAPGSTVATRELVSITGAPVRVPDPERLTHLQFRRFAGCPICHVHVQAIEPATTSLRPSASKRSSCFIRLLQRCWRISRERSPSRSSAILARSSIASSGSSRAHCRILKPKVLRVELRGLLAKRRAFGLDLHGGPLGLPADFLIAPSGAVLAAKYGADAYDQWSVDDVLKLAAQHSAPAAAGP